MSIIDPFFMCMIAVVFADAVPLFLFKLGECRNRDFLFFLLSEMLFWSSFCLFSNRKAKFSPCKFKNENNILKGLFVYSFLIYLVTKIYTWTYLGIPLFMETRLEMYRDAIAGAGIFTKLGYISSLFVTIYAYWRIIDYKERKYVLALLFVLLDCVLSGSKAGILVLVHSYFFFSYFYKKKKIKISFKYLFLILSFPIVIVILGVGSEYDAGFLGGFLSTLVRVSAYGDVYWYAYPNNIIDSVNYRYPMLQFFSGILGPLRIISWSEMDVPIGIKLYWTIINSDEGVFGGPNARIPITAWIYFKWGGLIFSIVAGCLMAKFVYGIRKKIPQSLLGIIIYVFFYKAALNIPTDFMMFFDDLVTILLFLLLYGFLFLSLSKFNPSLVRFNPRMK